MAENDKKYLEAFLGGDKSGAQALISAYASQLLNHTTHMLKGDRARAEDIVQDCFVKLWKHAQKLLEKDELHLRAWLFRVATNAVIDLKRKPVDEGGEVLEFIPSGAPSAEAQMIREQRAEFAMKLVGELPERQRAAVLMSHFEGMGNIEISETLDISVEAVESLLSRARRTMRTRAEELKEAI